MGASDYVGLVPLKTSNATASVTNKHVGYSPSTVTHTFPIFSGTMYSESHPMPPWEHEDSGGMWYQEFTKSSRTVNSGKWKKSPFNQYVEGQLVLGDYISMTEGSTTLPFPSASLSEMKAFGATAIARTEPTQEYFSAATALGELYLDRIPDIPLSNITRDRVNLARSAGSDYLNVEFGWKPLISDLQTLGSAIQKSDDIMEAYRAGSGKITRASYEGPTLTETYRGTATQLPVPGRSPHVTFASGPITTVRSSRMWFSGAYRYYVPDPGSGPFAGLRELAQKARKVYGVIPSPETLWNIAPWSWAADWVGNTGDILHNFSAIGRDGLVLKYGYVMHETKWTQRRSIDASFGYGTLTRTDEFVRRIRIKASPYGFGITSDGLTPRQTAILVALGASRT